MTEAIITRTQIIVVGEVTKNSYGDLIFTDKEGINYPKISAKRVSYFEKIILPGATVQLNYAMAYNKEYIYSAIPGGDKGTGESIKVVAPIPPTPETKPDTSRVIPFQTDPKNKSYALSYAKDLAVSSVIK